MTHKNTLHKTFTLSLVALALTGCLEDKGKWPKEDLKPVIESIAHQPEGTIVNGDTVTISASASDDGDQLTYSFFYTTKSGEQINLDSNGGSASYIAAEEINGYGVEVIDSASQSTTISTELLSILNQQEVRSGLKASLNAYTENGNPINGKTPFGEVSQNSQKLAVLDIGDFTSYNNNPDNIKSSANIALTTPNFYSTSELNEFAENINAQTINGAPLEVITSNLGSQRREKLIEAQYAQSAHCTVSSTNETLCEFTGEGIHIGSLVESVSCSSDSSTLSLTKLNEQGSSTFFGLTKVQIFDNFTFGETVLSDCSASNGEFTNTLNNMVNQIKISIVELDEVAPEVEGEVEATLYDENLKKAWEFGFANIKAQATDDIDGELDAKLSAEINGALEEYNTPNELSVPLTDVETVQFFASAEDSAGNEKSVEIGRLAVQPLELDITEQGSFTDGCKEVFVKGYEDSFVMTSPTFTSNEENKFLSHSISLLENDIALDKNQTDSAFTINHTDVNASVSYQVKATYQCQEGMEGCDEAFFKEVTSGTCSLDVEDEVLTSNLVVEGEFYEGQLRDNQIVTLSHETTNQKSQTANGNFTFDVTVNGADLPVENAEVTIPDDTAGDFVVKLIRVLNNESSVVASINYPLLSDDAPTGGFINSRYICQDACVNGVTAKFEDINGDEITSTISINGKVVAAGNNEVTFTGEELPSGTYTLTASATANGMMSEESTTELVLYRLPAITVTNRTITGIEGTTINPVLASGAKCFINEGLIPDLSPTVFTFPSAISPDTPSTGSITVTCNYYGLRDSITVNYISNHRPPA